MKRNFKFKWRLENNSEKYQPDQSWGSSQRKWWIHSWSMCAQEDHRQARKECNDSVRTHPKQWYHGTISEINAWNQGDQRKKL